MLRSGFLSLLGLILASAGWAQNHPPEIKDVRFQQRTDGSFIVDVYYTAIDADGDALTISIQASNDNGANWSYGCSHVSGDVGKGISAGAGKHIVWNFFEDHPNVSENAIKVKIIADDIKSGLDFSWMPIPSGPFTFGERPVTLQINYDYEIMKYPVTNAQYMQFLTEALANGKISVQGNMVTGSYPGDQHWPAGVYALYYLNEGEKFNIGRINYNGSAFVLLPHNGFLNHPVVSVTWFGAWAFAQYYGARLPTEEEWEKAARGNTGYEYPWGYGISGELANYANSGDPYDDGTTPVGFYDGKIHEGFQTSNSQSPYGVYDMAGNVWQWTDSFVGEEAPIVRIYRGGSWAYKLVYALKSSFRGGYLPEYRGVSIGFRCARTK